MDTRNPGNVIGGHKANISNPHTSKESKQHSKEVLEDLGTETATSSSRATSNKNKGHVIGGYKAALHNPHVSEEAKEHAKEVLDTLE
ncbi:hypothetical protein EX30DRAFT_323454 [Ascodesmis nigricans]|uniref:Conidiation protein 6 n=1 Tax=Ascodesmis nigricans TaxID=341454 RepID=A0A4V3SHV1_9PEZI|nr:hypothetical protein EX30DRAFT_323454 [Ascodesmis nigricans]